MIICSFGVLTATGLSALVDGAISHDQITQFLLRRNYTSQTLRQQTKPLVRAMEQDDGVLSTDDTIQEKPHTDGT